VASTVPASMHYTVGHGDGILASRPASLSRTAAVIHAPSMSSAALTGSNQFPPLPTCDTISARDLDATPRAKQSHRSVLRAGGDGAPRCTTSGC